MSLSFGGANGLVSATSERRPLYLCRPLINGDELRKWARKQGLKTALPADDMHVTVVFSKAPVAWDFADEASRVVASGGDRSVEKFGDATVLCFESPALATRWRSYRSRGASWDFDDYRPHVTVTYKHSGDIDKIEPFHGDLVFGYERFSEIKEDAGEDVPETSLAKLSHSEAAYREFGTPDRHCAKCSMWRDRPKDRCTLVEDPVDWYGTCKYFERRKAP